MMIDRQWSCRPVKCSEGTERCRLSARHRQVNEVQSIRVLQKRGVSFQDDVVLIQPGIHGGDLTLAKGVVERVIDGLCRHAQSSGSLAIDLKRDLESVILLV